MAAERAVPAVVSLFACRARRAMCATPLVLLACSSDKVTSTAISPQIPVTPPPTPPGRLTGVVMVSEPIARAGGGPAAYVALAPRAIDSWETISILNQRTRTTITPVMRLSGFDPVAIAANVGDTLIVTVMGFDNAKNETRVLVPVNAAPRLVRFDPASSSANVLPEDDIRIVFSEPLDLGKSAGGIRLRHAGDEVAGRLALDSTTTTVHFTPTASLQPSTVYEVSVGTSTTDLAGQTLTETQTARFTTAPTGTVAGAASLVGVWEATSWQFTVFQSNNTFVEDPVLGFGGNCKYQIRLTVTRAFATSVRWRWEEVYRCGNNTWTSVVTGVATVGDNWLLGRTDTSPWLDAIDPCVEGYLCPLQEYFDLQRNGDSLTLVRRDDLTYVDDFGKAWPARERLVLQRVAP